MTAISPRLDDQLCFSLYTASRLVTRAYTPMLAELGLTYPQYVTMLALWDAGEPMTVGELGKRLHLENGTLTPLLKRLEAAGLIARTRDGADERRVLITVTASGAALRQAACDIPERIVSRYGGDAKNVTALREILDQLITTLETEPI
jgi:MarR family transcriptional regulator, organic hydroperoxide resistance regulator